MQEQEQDPRRDVLGCNRNYTRTLQANPRKTVIDRKPQPFHQLEKRQLGLPPKKERAYQEKTRKKPT
jgi:hypothetical protein